MMLMHQKNGENNIINKEMQQLLNKTKKIENNDGKFR